MVDVAKEVGVQHIVFLWLLGVEKKHSTSCENRRNKKKIQESLIHF